jgi:DNA anti-recombination protein RmuC
MGLGGTAKKLQKVMDAAEQLYSKMNEIIGELRDLQSEVETTSEQVDRIEQDLARQEALLEAVAERQGIDTEAVLAEADLPDGGADGDDGASAETTDAEENPTGGYAGAAGTTTDGE